MTKKIVESELTIDSDKPAGGRGSRLHMKWKAVPFWYVVLISLFTVTEGKTFGGAGGFGMCRQNRPSFLSTNSNNIPVGGTAGAYNELAIVPYDVAISSLRGGAAAALNPFPAGYNPFGHSLTSLGERYLSFDGSLESDVGTFLSTLKGGKRKSAAVMKEQWLEIVRVGKKGQSMRVYRQLDDLIDFCLKSGFID